MSQHDQKSVSQDASHAPSGVARAFSSALGFVRRLVPRRDDPLRHRKQIRGPAARPDERAPAPAKPFVAAPPPAPATPLVRELLKKQKTYRAEIEQLEGQIEPLYDSIARGAAGPPSAFRGAELEEMVERSRHMRDDLQAKRLELARIERMLARERRLEPALAIERELPSGGEATRPRAPARAPRPPSPSPQEREVAAALERFSSPVRSHYLVFEKAAQALFDEDANIRRHAAIQLAELPSAGSQELLLRALEDPVERVRVAALNALANHVTPPDVFQRFLHDKSPHLRLASLRGLAKLESRVGEPALIAALEDDDPAVRRSVATLLGWREAKPAVRPLSRALRDEDPSVREAAAEALAQIRSDKGVLSLIRALDDETEAVRKVAERALRAIAGDEIDKISEGRSGEPRVSALKQWWKESRVAILTAQQKRPRREVSPASAVKLAEPSRPPSPRAAESIRETAQAARAAALKLAETSAAARAGAVKAQVPAGQPDEPKAARKPAAPAAAAVAGPVAKATKPPATEDKAPAPAPVAPAVAEKPAAKAAAAPDVAARVAEATTAVAAEQAPAEGTKDAGNEEFESLFADAESEKPEDGNAAEATEEGAISAKDLL
jgi:hypothetical protein